MAVNNFSTHLFSEAQVAGEETIIFMAYCKHWTWTGLWTGHSIFFLMNF